MDWSYLQSFVAVAEHESLSAAARTLNTSQPTISRHIARLEQQLGARLFERAKSGAVLTQAGSELMGHATTMADAAAKMSMLREGQSEAVTGTVRITASRIVASFLLPAILSDLHQKWPELEVEVVASDETHNLLRREADIAVRMYRPTQLDLIAQHVGELGLALYATPDYLERHGPLTDLTQFKHHKMIGYDRSTLIIDGMRDAGIDVDRHAFHFRSDDQVVCWQMVRAGFGIGFNQIVIGDADPSVVRVSGPDPLGQMPVWLSAHNEMHQSARIRRVFDFLKDGLRAASSHA